MNLTLQDFKIFFIDLLFLLIAEVIWNFIALFLTLKIFKLKELLYSAKFYYYISGGAISSSLVDRGFKSILNTDFLKGIFGGNLIYIFMTISIVFLIIIHFYFCYLILDLDGKTSLKLALILGILTAPWPTFISKL